MLYEGDVMAHQKEPCVVLIVDDDPLSCSSIEQFLLREGISTACAANGKQALDIFSELKPQVYFSV